MSKLLEVINDPASTVVLECTRGHRMSFAPVYLGGNWIINNYKKGQRIARHMITIDPMQTHWKVAAKKYQLKPIKTEKHV